MNVFYTNDCPIQAANEHNHVHERKMIVEYAQLLSTAHRLLDGVKTRVWVKTVKCVKLECGLKIPVVKCKEIEWYELPSDSFRHRFGRRWLVDKELYAHSHVNHPSAVWVRKSYDHYIWVWECAKQLSANYTERKGKIHKTEAVLDLLAPTPDNISEVGFVRPPVAAPDEFKALAAFGDVCKAYHAYLCVKFEEWLSRDKVIPVEFDVVPEWYVAGYSN